MSLLRDHIVALAKQHGSLRAAARVFQIDHSYLYSLSSGEKDDPSAEVLKKLGLRQIVSYEVCTCLDTDCPYYKKKPASHCGCTNP